MINAVMFDFSGTLLCIEPVASWYRAVAAPELTPDQFDRDVAELVRLGAQPGGPAPQTPPPGWDARDDSAAQHRAAYTVQTLAAIDDPKLADALYDRHLLPEAWTPYPDALPVLRELRERGVPVAVVSNVGWDLRPLFVHHGLDPYVDSYQLSYELGFSKPDPRIFRAACAALGSAPEHTLMIGDHPEADGAAAALGSPFLQVAPLPPADRPDALTEVLTRL